MTMSKELQKKLSEYAPEPPVNTWEAIAKALDEAPQATSFVKSLYEYEETPPMDTWSRISAALDMTTGAKVIPFPKSNRRTVQYVAAAVILLAFALGAGLMIGNRTITPSITSSNAALNIPADTEAKKVDPQNDVAVSPGLPSPSLLENADPIQSSHKENRSIISRIRPSTQLGNVLLAANFIPKTAEGKQTVSNYPASDKYMVYSDNEGNAMKLPKKLFDFITCVREDVLCKEQMLELQEKLASTSLNTDFTGVLEILKNLKENQ
jgi:hypothetical protein